MQVCFFHTTTIKGILKKLIFFKNGSTEDFKNTGSCFPKPLPMRNWKKTRCSPNFHLAVSRIHGVRLSHLYKKVGLSAGPLVADQ